MVVLLSLLVLWNARSVYRGYVYNHHWFWAMPPAFCAAVAFCTIIHILATAFYWGTSIWFPDWRDPSFFILAPENW